MTTEVEFVQMPQDGKIIIPKKLREGFEEGTPSYTRQRYISPEAGKIPRCKRVRSPS